MSCFLDKKRQNVRYVALILMLLSQVSGVTLAQQASGSGQATVEGTVVNAINARQIPRAGVLLRNIQQTNNVVWTRADDTGRFLFKNVGPGTYRLSGDRQGFFTENRKNATQALVDVSARDHLTNVLVRLLPFSVVAGRIVDEKNDPIQNVEMRLYAWDYVRGRRLLGSKASAVTDDRGEYRISGVRPGSYFLLANYDFKKEWLRSMGDLSKSTRPDIAYLPQFFPGTTDFREAQQLTLKPGDEVFEDFAFSSRPAVSVHGKVVNGLSGRPASKAIVSASWANVPVGINPIKGEADENGIFEIWGLAPGSYTLQTSFQDQGENYSGEEQVEVGSAGVAEANIAGMPDFEINGQVRIEGTQRPALRQVSVDFMAIGNRPFAIFRAAAAPPSFRLAGKLHLETHYRVNAVNLEDDYYLKSILVAGKEMPQTDVVVGGKQSEVEVILSPLGGHIEGIVLDFKNQPMRGSFVMLAPDVAESDPGQIRQIRSDGNGKFILRGVPPGAYRLVAFEDVTVDDLMAQPEVLKRFVDQGASVKVEEGGKYNNVIPKFIPADASP
ncbi:MAG TPA: carboxypeptidase-like regulatory domain-containing protein [Candidatus Solibacter sp.]|nr:carboxypeptidase-like regulatory domain-containing protein [Candidatus Solibacter sp.]